MSRSVYQSFCILVYNYLLATPQDLVTHRWNLSPTCTWGFVTPIGLANSGLFPTWDLLQPMWDLSPTQDLLAPICRTYYLLSRTYQLIRIRFRIQYLRTIYLIRRTCYLLHTFKSCLLRNGSTKSCVGVTKSYYFNVHLLSATQNLVVVCKTYFSFSTAGTNLPCHDSNAHYRVQKRNMYIISQPPLLLFPQATREKCLPKLTGQKPNIL